MKAATSGTTAAQDPQCLCEDDKKEQTLWPSHRGSLDPARLGRSRTEKGEPEGGVYSLVTAPHGVTLGSDVDL